MKMKAAVYVGAWGTPYIHIYKDKEDGSQESVRLFLHEDEDITSSIIGKSIWRKWAKETKV